MKDSEQDLAELENFVEGNAQDASDLVQCTSQIVSAYIQNSEVEGDEIIDLIDRVHKKLRSLRSDEADYQNLRPAVPIEESVTENFIICLEDGKKFKMLKKHLMSIYGLTPAEYRRKWGLPADYPMTAPSYAKRRQELAKAIGLGQNKS